MGTPKEILSIERPKNSIVHVYGKNKDKYSVIERIGCKRINGKNIPIQGKTIGHIINGKYVPLNEKITVKKSSIKLKDWADYVLSDKLFNDIFSDLCNVYNYKDALKIYCISILRVCEPGISDNELLETYENSFLSELYPSVGLSKNTVSELFKNLGKTYNKIIEFMKLRTSKLSLDSTLLIDGTLKRNNSKINSLSEFSYKSKVKQSKEISVLYSFDLEKMEPICSKCYPGNMLDSTAYEDFLISNDIKSGLIVADKGFPSSAVKEHFSNNSNLHYLNPIKRNSKFIETHTMNEFSNILPNYDGITYKKEKVNGIDKWLYSFRDSYKASTEEKDYLTRVKKAGNYNDVEFKKMQRTFGLIVLESDLDLNPEIIYKAYKERWNIEIVMRYYKSALEFCDTRVQDDYSVMGSEFCDFLSTILTFRLLKVFEKNKLLLTMNYKRIMSILRKAKKIQINENENWKLIKINPSQQEILEKLGLVLNICEEPKKKRGRPKKETI